MTHTSHRSHRANATQPPYVGIRGYNYPAAEGVALFGPMPTAANATHVMVTCQEAVTDNTAADADADGRAYLAMAADDLRGAVHWLTLALKGRDDWQEALGLELDTLRGVLAAIEQEIQP